MRVAARGALFYPHLIYTYVLSQHPRMARTSSYSAVHFLIMVSPLLFKGDKKFRKRKAGQHDLNQDHEGTSKPFTVQADTQEDDNWVTAERETDLSGPVVFVLPSIKPTCIACDANGSIFASEIENMVGEDPATAEPHDVRQVWIASRVAGRESISFKGHHGR